jgi:hypothetical protein
VFWEKCLKKKENVWNYLKMSETILSETILSENRKTSENFPRSNRTRRMLYRMTAPLVLYDRTGHIYCIVYGPLITNSSCSPLLFCFFIFAICNLFRGLSEESHLQ